MTRSCERSFVSLEHIVRSILLLRGHPVLLDRGFAPICGITARRPPEQVERNAKRFHEACRLEPTAEEVEAFAAANCGLKTPPSRRSRPSAPRLHRARLHPAPPRSSATLAPSRWTSLPCAHSASTASALPRTRISPDVSMSSERA